MSKIEFLPNSSTEKNYPFQSKIEQDYFLNSRVEQVINFALGWHGGKIENYRFEVNVLKKSSKICINNGKIWKLCIWDSKKGMANGCVANYDQGWITKPSLELEPYIRQIMKLYK